jgi:hypothetical protein
MAKMIMTTAVVAEDGGRWWLTIGNHFAAVDEESCDGIRQQRMQQQKLKEQWDSPMTIKRGDQWRPRGYFQSFFRNQT